MKTAKILVVLLCAVLLYSCNGNSKENKKKYNKMISEVHDDVTQRWMKIATTIQKGDSLTEENFSAMSKLGTFVLAEVSKLDSISVPSDGENLKTAMKSQLYYLSDGCKTFRKNFYSSRSVYTKYEINEWFDDNHSNYMKYVRDTEKAQKEFMKVEKEEKKPIF